MKTFNLVLEVVSIGILGMFALAWLGILLQSAQGRKTTGAKIARMGYVVSVVSLGLIGGPITLYFVVMAAGQLYREANWVFWVIIVSGVYYILYRRLSHDPDQDNL